jgi:hypothetical protein
MKTSAIIWILILQSWTGAENRPVVVGRYLTEEECLSAGATAQKQIKVYGSCIPTMPEVPHQ